jgi:signal transduction histidine kinase
MVIAFAVYMIFVRQKLKKTNLLLAEKNAQVQQQNKAIENYNEKINQAYLQLKDLGEYKQAMVNMLIHDLKNPLNTLKHIDIFEDENERKEIINHISKKMLNLVLNMLDVNRGEENKITLIKEELSLRKLLKLAIEDVEFLCRHENIQIEFCFKNDFLIHGDKEILCRVFVNLYLNALKFSPSKGIILLNIEEVTDGAIVVSVKDQGPGIEEKHHRLIFEKFTQLQKINSGKIPSSGLGLAFCKMAIELHGWIIGLESKPGDGAKFWIKISDYKKLPKQNMDTLSMDKKESKSVSGAN